MATQKFKVGDLVVRGLNLPRFAPSREEFERKWGVTTNHPVTVYTVYTDGDMDVETPKGIACGCYQEYFDLYQPYAIDYDGDDSDCV